MKPIGQTFFINEPLPPLGAPGVFVTRIDVYFQSVSNNYGIEMQIRTTDNGFPTDNRLPFASKVLLPEDTWPNSQPIIVSSTDASKPTSFIFDTPVFLQSNKPYAFVLAPLGGNPEYNVWTAAMSGRDVTSGGQIFKNNDSGTLFLSSNDRDWTPIINEDMKYKIYTANFTSTSGTAYFNTPDEEWFAYKDNTGDFLVREKLVFGNGYFDISVLNISGVSGTFTSGDTVYQTVGSANVSGILYSANSTVLKIANATGAFSVTTLGTPLIFDATSGANASVTAVSQNCATTLGSNTINLPDSTIFSVNNVIYVQTNNRSKSQVVKITAKPTTTSIQVNSAMTFTDTNALYGRVKNDGNLNGGFSGSIIYENINFGIVDVSTANAVTNFANMSYVQVIGLTTGVSANLVGFIDSVYNSLTTGFSSIAPSNTTLSWYMKGFKNDNNRTPDASFIPIEDGVPNEFYDYERVSMARSNELANLPVGRGGNSSLIIKTDFATANSKLSPVIDTMQTAVTFTYNIVASQDELTGYYLSISNSSGTFSNNDTLSQTAYGNTSTGKIRSIKQIPGINTINSTSLIVTNVNGKFVDNTVFTTSNSASGKVNTAEKYSEALNNGYPAASRYISRNVVLAVGQDSEDIRTYIAAYRPATTNLNIYAKIINSSDSAPFETKDWTRLSEVGTQALQSSPVNPDDKVELIYGFPQSSYVFLSNTTVNSTSNTVICADTGNLTNNMFVYLTNFDSTAAAANSGFNVREIVYVVNTTAFVVDRPPSFDTANAGFGIIQGIESTSSAFLYDKNDYIVRYVTPEDSVFDSYIQFAIKIVPTAQTSALVPRVNDLRVLALQV